MMRGIVEVTCLYFFERGLLDEKARIKHKIR